MDIKQSLSQLADGCDLSLDEMKDVMGQIMRERVDFRNFWGNLPDGFVPGGGSLNLEIVEYLKKKWIRFLK